MLSPWVNWFCRTIPWLIFTLLTWYVDVVFVGDSFLLAPLWWMGEWMGWKGLGEGLGTAGSILPLGPAGPALGFGLTTFVAFGFTKAEYCWKPMSFFLFVSTLSFGSKMNTYNMGISYKMSYSAVKSLRGLSKLYSTLNVCRNRGLDVVRFRYYSWRYRRNNGRDWHWNTGTSNPILRGSITYTITVCSNHSRACCGRRKTFCACGWWLLWCYRDKA